jgi:hypothetical protein
MQIMRIASVPVSYALIIMNLCNQESQFAAVVMSRVYCSVTNNNGFWIGSLDLLTPSFLITINYSAIANLPTSPIVTIR